jgi:hypothetical protein
VVLRWLHPGIENGCFGLRSALTLELGECLCGREGAHSPHGIGRIELQSFESEIACRRWVTFCPMMLLCPAFWARHSQWMTVFIAMLVAPCSTQEAAQMVSTEKADESSKASETPAPKTGGQINVNWFYGSYVPKDVPLESLDGTQRLKLYTRQTYTTWGIYIKTLAFTLHDQIHNSDPEWGDDFAGFAKRFGSRQAQFIIQNSITSLGDGILGWEPRYDRCHCDGIWPRTRHAIVRNFVTYNRSEKSLRPQIMPFLGAFASSTIATTWEPGHPSWQVKGYQAITQIPIGMGINIIGEFAPEIGRILHRR